MTNPCSMATLDATQQVRSYAFALGMRVAPNALLIARLHVEPRRDLLVTYILHAAIPARFVINNGEIVL